MVKARSGEWPAESTPAFQGPCESALRTRTRGTHHGLVHGEPSADSNSQTELLEACSGNKPCPMGRWSSSFRVVSFFGCRTLVSFSGLYWSSGRRCIYF